MSKEKSVDSVDVVEFLKIVRTLLVQVKILKDLNIPDGQRNLTREALKNLVATANKYIDDGSGIQ